MASRLSGAFPTSVEHVDFLAADAHKWLLGPCGAGLFFVRKSLQEKLRPAVYGWHNVRCPNFVAQEQLVYPSDSRRYEAGSANLLGLVGLNAAMELILEIGVENIAARLLHLRGLLAAGVAGKRLDGIAGRRPGADTQAALSAFTGPTPICPRCTKNSWRRALRRRCARTAPGGITSGSPPISTIRTRKSSGCWRSFEASLRAEEEHGHADAVLDAAGGGAEKQVGQEAVSVRAHRHQVAAFLLEPI